MAAFHSPEISLETAVCRLPFAECQKTGVENCTSPMFHVDDGKHTVIGDW